MQWQNNGDKMKYLKKRQAIYDNYVSRGVPELLAACFCAELTNEGICHGVDESISFYQDVKGMVDYAVNNYLPADFWEQFTFYDNTGKVQYDKNNRPTSITIKL